MDASIIERIQSYCAYQERCHLEVRNKLLSWEIYGDALESYIAHLIEHNFLNEERFAAAYVRGKFNNNHWGRKKIVQALKLKQVSDYCIKKGLQEINENDYQKLLFDLAEKKAKSLMSEKNSYIHRQKITQYLLQKGFEYERIDHYFRNK